DVNAGSCPFEITAGAAGSADYGGNLTFATAAESKAVTADNGDVIVAGQQPLTTAAPALAHSAGEAVSQPVVNCNPTVIGSPGTVANALTASGSGATQVLPGENNQPAGTVTVSEAPSSPAGTLGGETLTFTISSPASGVVFSVAPPVTTTGGVTAPATCALSVDRHTCTVSGIANPGATGSVTIHPTLDVDASVPLGTA